MAIYRLEDVFVPAGFPEITYYDRIQLKKKFQAAKMNRSKHICVFGSSKVGKSNLWKKNFTPKEYIKMGINSDTNINDIYKEILTQLEAFYISESETEDKVESSILAGIKASLKCFMSANVEANIKASSGLKETQTLIVKPLVSANTIVKYLKAANKRVIIEDFHYANEILTQVFSQDLKVFSDEGCQFVLISIPCRTQYLLRANEELQGRLSDIPVEMFNPDELRWIINKGTETLNISFPPSIIESIIEEANGNASIVQNICQMICIECNILETVKGSKKKHIDDISVFKQACIDVAESLKSSYEQIINAIRVHKHGNDKSDVYKWILKIVQTKKIDDAGISNTEIFHLIRKNGNQDIKLGSVTFGLRNFANILNKNHLPLVFEFDEHKTFYVRDKYMAFVFKWLPNMIESLFLETNMN